MLRIKWGELFPSKLSIIIFLSYMFLFVNQGILVTASQTSDKHYTYSTTVVVLLTEVFKLIASVVLYCRNEKFSTMLSVIGENTKLLGFYFVPSVLYCFYNNLSFINLSLFDPTTYYLLLQFRVVLTAVLFRYGNLQEASNPTAMGIVGYADNRCMIKHIDFGGSLASTDSTEKHIVHQIFSLSAGLILVQGFCSSLAGVYNEYLLKSKGLTVDIYIQNVFMYLDSIVCNIVIIIFEGKGKEIFNYASLQSILRLNVLVIMINSAAIGIVTSFFLKTMNSILKTFASALELVFTAIACYLLFGIQINLYTILSILIVSVSVIFYSQNPVDNQPKNVAGSSAQEHLLEEGVSD